jgi:hypothetical protein
MSWADDGHWEDCFEDSCSRGARVETGFRFRADIATDGRSFEAFFENESVRS